MTEATKQRKLISARKGVESKSEQAREIMRQYSGQKTYKEFVDEIQQKTKLSRMIAARYLKVNAPKIEGFTTADNKI